MAAAFPELSWVPLIRAWMGHPGRQCGQTPSDVAAGLLDLGTSGWPVSSLGAVGLSSLSPANLGPCPGWKVGFLLLGFRAP